MASLNKLITRISSITELKQLFIEILMNNTDKISKVSDESVVNAVSYGVAKLAQKVNKDVAIIESLIFPESASREYLDRAALIFGGLTRLGATGSSTFVRVKASSGTQYIPGVHTFSSNTGVQFETTEITTIGVNGFGYIPIRSINTGKSSNVPAQTILNVTPTPTGHTSCLNEYAAVGGRDSESDESFKIRIRSYPNLQAQNTLDRILEVMRLYDPNILRILGIGIVDDKVGIRIATENGAFFTDSELVGILEFIDPYLSLTDAYRQGNTFGVELTNIQWRYVDMDFRVKISSSYVVDDVRQSIQQSISKHIDFRYWEEEQSVQWDDLLQIVKSVDGVDYVPDEFFTPGSDVRVEIGELPRVRGFIMRDISGNILFDSTNSLTPVFYENGI